MIRKLIKIAVFLVIANGIYRVAPVTLHYFEFKDAVGELALYSQTSTDVELANRVMTLAQEHSIPIEPEYVEVARRDGSLHIDATYVEHLRLFPGYDYPWQFDVHAKAFEIARPAHR